MRMRFCPSVARYLDPVTVPAAPANWMSIGHSTAKLARCGRSSPLLVQRAGQIRRDGPTLCRGGCHMSDQSARPDDDLDAGQPRLAYLDPGFLESADARPLRILAEYLEPLREFRRQDIHD